MSSAVGAGKECKKVTTHKKQIARWNRAIHHYTTKTLLCQGKFNNKENEMERNHFKKWAEVKMCALGLTLNDMSKLLNVPVPRISEALNGDTRPRAGILRVNMDQTLNRLVDQKRERITADLEKAREIQCPHLQGKISVILPEDMIYIVTEDGGPVGSWNPVTKTYSELDAVLMPVVGRRVK